MLTTKVLNVLLVEDRDIDVTMARSAIRKAKAGAACYIQKPASMKELIKIFEVLHTLWAGTALLS